MDQRASALIGRTGQQEVLACCCGVSSATTFDLGLESFCVGNRPGERAESRNRSPVGRLLIEAGDLDGALV